MRFAPRSAPSQHTRAPNVVAQFSKTHSGKILRAIMRSMVGGRSFDMPSTIDDPEALIILHQALAGLRQTD